MNARTSIKGLPYLAEVQNRTLVQAMRKSSVIAITRGKEVLMGQRRADLAFLGGFHAFIGGNVEPGDDGDEYVACAIRELGEETGLAADFLDHAAKRLQLIGEWTTPAWSPLRYHSKFYVLALSPEECGELWNLPETLDPKEFSGGEWIRPRDALERWRCGEWMISEPIRAVLESLTEETTEDHFTNKARYEEAEIFPGVWALPLTSKTIPAGFTTPGMEHSPIISMGLRTNSIVLHGDELLIVDPGSDVEISRLLNLIETLNRRVQAIVLTHHHVDHVQGLNSLLEFHNAEIWCHAETAIRLNRRPDRLLKDGDVLRVGDQTWEVCWTPGHAPGHLALFEPNLRTLIAGDLMASAGTILIPPGEGDMGAYLSSLRRIHSLRPRTIIPSHGWIFGSAQHRIESYIDHRLSREARVVEAIVAIGGGSIDDLLPIVYADTPVHVWPLARLSLESHLIHLEAQGRVLRDANEYRLASDEIAGRLATPRLDEST